MVRQLCLAMDSLSGCLASNRLLLNPILKLNLFGWVIVDDWRILTDAWSLKPFHALSSVIMFVTLRSSLTKNLTFQRTLINLPVVATINFASCVLFLVPYLMMQLLPWSMLLLLVGSIIAARF